MTLLSFIPDGWLDSTNVTTVVAGLIVGFVGAHLVYLRVTKISDEISEAHRERSDRRKPLIKIREEQEKEIESAKKERAAERLALSHSDSVVLSATLNVDTR